MNIDFSIFLSLKRCHVYLQEEFSVVFGLVRRSKYVELQRQRDELEAYMKILTSEAETLQKKVAESRKETNASKQRFSQLQEETNKLRFQKEELANFVEILTKEREVFQKIIQDLGQATRKRKQTKP
jgi:predicted nuclease with TOPRIM domain